ncbi:hypothetical protein GCM10011579_022650 [Streptomyces albiflavescens]|uniref:Uncharacterized protein n=1 Tax=Streptomyces albiflavescens TaxID=1623582 RepID=A0A917XZ10_9ACTN|nr:hypothetical protein GCM10011579_022650 [Streptomyces albiflavescens]
MLDAGTGREHVQPAELGHRPLDQLPGLLRIRGVGPNGDRAIAVVAEFGDESVRCLLVAAVADRHRRAFVGQPPCDGRTDPTAAAGDDCDLAFETCPLHG